MTVNLSALSEIAAADAGLASIINSAAAELDTLAKSNLSAAIANLSRAADAAKERIDEARGIVASTLNNLLARIRNFGLDILEELSDDEWLDRKGDAHRKAEAATKSEAKDNAPALSGKEKLAKEIEAVNEWVATAEPEVIIQHREELPLPVAMRADELTEQDVDAILQSATRMQAEDSRDTLLGVECPGVQIKPITLTPEPAEDVMQAAACPPVDSEEDDGAEETPHRKAKGKKKHGRGKR